MVGIKRLFGCDMGDRAGRDGAAVVSSKSGRRGAEGTTDRAGRRGAIIAGMCALTFAAALSCPSAAQAATASLATTPEAGVPVASEVQVPAGTQLGEPASASESDAELQAKGIEKDTFTISVPGAFRQTEARSILDLVNAARAGVGSSALTWDTNLEQVAQLRAAELVLTFSHTRPDGRDCFTAAGDMGTSFGTTAGENIFMSSGNASAVVANGAWTNSPGHYQNMVNSSFTSMAAASFSYAGATFWVEVFGGTSGTGFNTQATDGNRYVNTEATAQYLPFIFSDVSSGDWFIQGGGKNFLYALNNKLMTGYSGTHYFGPWDSVTRGQVATILYRMEGSPAASSQDFSDVDYGQYYGNAIRWARSARVISGYDGNVFAPDNPVSREDLAVMLSNYAKYKGLDVSSDMAKAEAMPDWGSVDSYAQQALGWALDKGIMSGSDEGGVRYLRPLGNAQRCAAATMMATFHRDVLS